MKDCEASRTGNGRRTMSSNKICGLVVLLVLNFGWGAPCSPAQDAPPAIPAATGTSEKPAKLSHQDMAGTALEEARQLTWNGDYKRALTMYGEIIGGGKDVAAAYAGLARVLLKTRRLEEAEEAARKAVELEPALATAHVALGEVYFRQGNLQEAEQEFLIPLKAKNQEARALFGLARISNAAFNERGAKNLLDRAHRLDPKDPEINGGWLQTRPPSEQISALEAFVNPRNRGGHVTRAGARQMIAMLKDRTQHPDRTCQMVNKITVTHMNLEPLRSTTRRSSASSYTGVGLDVRLNRITARLMLETGDRIIIHQKLAEKVGAQLVVRTEAEGVGDESPPEGYMAYVESIRIGEIELKGCYVAVIEEASPHNSLSGFDGIIGAGILSTFLVDIDLPHLKLRLEELPPAEGRSEGEVLKADEAEVGPLGHRFIPAPMADWMPLYRSGDLLLLPTHANGAGPRLFCIALGAAVNLISPEAAREAGKVLDDQFVRLSGLNGTVKTSLRTEPMKLEFARAEYKTDAISVVDFSQFSRRGIEVSGTIGFEVLRDFEMKLNFRDGLVSFRSGK